MTCWLTSKEKNMSFLAVINEAQRNFKAEQQEEADIVFLTAQGLNALWHCICGCSPQYVSMIPSIKDGDMVMGFTVRLTDEKLISGFRLSSPTTMSIRIYYSVRISQAFLKNKRKYTRN